MARAKRNAVERQSDIQYLLELHLMNTPPGEILRRVNRRRQDQARRAAEDIGLHPDAVLEVVREAGLTTQTLSRDLRQVMKALRGGVNAAGELLVLERIRQLEVEMLHVNLAEQRAWEAYELSCGQEVTTTTTRQEAVMVEDESEEGETVKGKGKRMLRPKDIQRKTVNRIPDARFLEIVLRCVETRARIGGDIFELAARLGMASMVPEEVQRLRDGSAETIQHLLANELQMLYRAEARVLDNDGAAERRTKLLVSYLGSRGKGPMAPQGGGTGGAGGTWELRLREIGGGDG
jgi:hypothetical protein